MPYDLSQVTTTYDNGRGSHGERIGDTRRREPWAFFLTTKSPRLPEKVVGVATKTRTLMKVYLDKHRSLFDGQANAFMLRIEILPRPSVNLNGPQLFCVRCPDD